MFKNCKKIFPPRVCRICGATFTPLTARSLYCSDPCRNAAMREQIRAYNKRRKKYCVPMPPQPKRAKRKRRATGPVERVTTTRGRCAGGTCANPFAQDMYRWN